VDSTQFGPAGLLQDKTPVEPSRHIVRVQHQGNLRLNLRSLEDQIAVITGGGTGVGAALAVALAEAGADVYLIGRRLNKLELVAAKAREYGVNAAVQSADISTNAGQLEAVQQVRAYTGHLDILVLSAATFAAAPIEDADLSDFDKLYQLNVRAPYALTQAFSPMLKARRGQVVFINSSSGIAAKPMTGQYDSSKHALKAIADTFRAEVNAHGVRVLSIYLGRTASEMQERIFQMERRPYRAELLLQPEDVASVIVKALCLPRTAEVTDISMRPMIKS
jgi:NADP-dependent 3-hydroxy acid dehydrogenase YdfG